MNLQEEAEKYAWKKKNPFSKELLANELVFASKTDFIAGAKSKYVEAEKLKFAINELQKQNDYNEGFAQEMCLKRILELQQKLKDLENE